MQGVRKEAIAYLENAKFPIVLKADGLALGKGVLICQNFEEAKDCLLYTSRCGNFKDEEEGRRYIFDNVLKNHDTLPLGEFEIGTNTTAYAAGKKYGIEDKLSLIHI